MQDGDGRVVGLRLRTDAGFKYAAAGSRNGLFVPEGIAGADTLFLTEGPTDAASLLGLGFSAVGRACALGGLAEAVRLARRIACRTVVVVGDRDDNPADVGRRGANAIAVGLLPHVPMVKLILPPSGIKDAREWINGGAGAADVEHVVRASSPLRLTLRRKEGGAR